MRGAALVLLMWGCLAAVALAVEGEPERLHGEPEPEPLGPEPEPEPKPGPKCNRNIAPLCKCETYDCKAACPGGSRACTCCPEHCIWDKNLHNCDTNKPKPPPGSIDDSNSAARRPAYLAFWFWL